MSAVTSIATEVLEAVYATASAAVAVPVRRGVASTSLPHVRIDLVSETELPVDVIGMTRVVIQVTPYSTDADEALSLARTLFDILDDSMTVGGVAIVRLQRSMTQVVEQDEARVVYGHPITLTIETYTG